METDKMYSSIAGVDKTALTLSNIIIYNLSAYVYTYSSITSTAKFIINDKTLSYTNNQGRYMYMTLNNVTLDGYDYNANTSKVTTLLTNPIYANNLSLIVNTEYAYESTYTIFYIVYKQL